MNVPKISVILPTYNGAKYLRESIESVIAQTYTDWELIIINDCSTDDTLRIAEEYAAKEDRITVRTNKENLKLPRSLNAGFALAKGEYLSWTSDDNRYKPEAFSVMSDYLDVHNDCGMVCCAMDLIEEDGSCIRRNLQPEPEKLVYDNAIGACFMYTREAMERTGIYDSDMFLAEDYDYWLRIYQQFPIVHLDQSLYEYRVHGGSLTGTRLHEILVQTAKLKIKHLDFILEHLSSKRDVMNLFCQLKEAEIIAGEKQMKRFHQLCPLAPFYYQLRKLYLKTRRLFSLLSVSIYRIIKND